MIEGQKCECCGGPIVPFNARRHYCSDVCRHRARYLTHQTEHKEYYRNYYQQKKVHVDAVNRQWCERNKVSLKAYKTRYYQAHKKRRETEEAR